jgi:hypothetical protein
MRLFTVNAEKGPDQMIHSLLHAEHVSVLQGAEQYIQQLTQSLSRMHPLLLLLLLRLSLLLLPFLLVLLPSLLLLLLLAHGSHNPLE